MKAFAWLVLGMFASQVWAQGPVAAPSSAQTEAADVVLLTGHGSALGSDGRARKLQRGDKLYAGDIVNSGADSYLNMHFRDGGYILLRPNTRFQIEAYNAGPAAVAQSAAAPSVQTQTDAPRAFFRLLRGGFRAVSGVIGKGRSDEFRVATPVTTIGIRGTDYLVILPTALEAKDPVFSASNPKISAKGGVLVGVISGGVFMRNTDGRQMDVAEGQYAITLKNGSQVLLPFQPQFLKLSPVPDPTKACP